VIKSFRDADTERIFKREFVNGFPCQIQQRAFMKLNAIDAAARLEDLRLPHSNRLEVLKGDRRERTAFASITNGRSAFSGGTAMRSALRSSITIEEGLCRSRVLNRFIRVRI
jgi:plasmid maintenance system killer protein